MRRARRRTLLALALLPVASPALAEPASLYELPLRFVDDGNRLRELSEWRGRAVVVTMAYGACRSVCSTTLRTLEALQVEADRHGIALDFIVASVDPAEDTPQDWAAWRHARRLERSNWTFLSGTPEATRSLAQWLGIRLWRYDEHVMHDFRIVRLDAEGAARAALDWHRRDLERML